MLFVKLLKHLKAPAYQSRSRYRLCVPPCPCYISSGIHTVCAWSDCSLLQACRVALEGADSLHFWVASTAYASLPGGGDSLWGGSFHQCSSRYLPHFRQGGEVAVLVGITDGSDRGNEDGRAPIFFLSLQIQCQLSEIGSPPPRFFPSEKGLDAPPVFYRGWGQGGRRWAFTKRNVCTRILWTNVKRNKVIEKKMWSHSISQ